MLRKQVQAILLGSVLLALSLAAWSQSKDRLIEKYTPLAGSEANATSLVNGLRDDKEVNLSGTTFTPPTHKMGYGNVNIALSLAEAELKKQGITNPTPEQLKTALVGDATHKGILQLRAEGMGWGKIANSLGFKLGDVMRSAKAEGRDQTARADKPERPACPDKPERPEKPERAERGGR